MLQLYMHLASSRLARHAIQPIQPIQLYSYTRYTAYSTIYSLPQLTLAHWRTLGTLARCGSLPMVQHILGNQITDEGCAALASTLRGAALPALKHLHIDGNPASK